MMTIEQAKARAPSSREAYEKVDSMPDPGDAPAELTDAGNAARLTTRHGQDLKFVPAWGWVVWTGKTWARDELKARQVALETARGIHAEAATVSDNAEQKALSDWARKSQNAQRVQAMLWCAQPELAARPEDFDREPWLLPCANGTIDLRTGEVHPHRREHFLTRACPVVFDAKAQCPEWQKFLERVLPSRDVREYVQRFAGYSLTGSTAEQSLAFLYGSGRNGKSVFLETLGSLLGDYHTATRVDSLAVTRGGGIPNDVAALAGARMVSVSETPEGVRLNESLVKDLTGGDTITARFLRHEFFQFKPQFKLWIRGNHKPQIRGTDDGIWRRLALVPFTVQIPLAEVDPGLSERLQGELSGILNWAVKGCRVWQQSGLKPPQAVTEAVAEYRDEMDSLGEFITSRCVTAPNVKAKASELYGAYRQWCEDSGEHPMSQRRFGLALGERGFQKTVPKSVVWVGIGLLSDLADDSDLSRSSSQSRARNPRDVESGSPRSERSEDESTDCPKCGGEGCRWCAI